MRHVLGMALLAMTMACSTTTARAAEKEFDPAKVSESLKAIFQFGSVATKQALNANTVTLISGTIGGTYVQFGADLASVLDDGNKLRVLPIVGRGSSSVADILFLQGVDLGIVRADTLDYLEKKGFAKDIKKQFTYVTKLYNEEMYVIASKSVTSISQLNGKKVSVDLPNGGTFVTAAIVFERLGIKPNFLYIEQRIAMEKLKAGEIDAVIACGGKPYKSVAAFKDDRFHLVPVDYAKPLQGDYLPARRRPSAATRRPRGRLGSECARGRARRPRPRRRSGSSTPPCWLPACWRSSGCDAVGACAPRCLVIWVRNRARTSPAPNARCERSMPASGCCAPTSPCRAAARSLIGTGSQIGWVEISPDGDLDLRLTAPATLPLPWTGEDQSWRLGAEVPIEILGEDARQVGQPCVALVQLGVTAAGNELLVDLEACGVLAVVARSDQADEVVTAIATALASSLFAEVAHLVAVSLPEAALLNHRSAHRTCTADAAIELACTLVGTTAVNERSSFELRSLRTGVRCGNPPWCCSVRPTMASRSAGPTCCRGRVTVSPSSSLTSTGTCQQRRRG